MKNWNKKIGLAILSFGLLSFAPNSANAQGYQGYYGNGCCDPCASDCCGFGGFEVGADFLWWRPSQDGLAFGVEWDQLPPDCCCDPFDFGSFDIHGKAKCLDAKWEPGFRIYISKESCICDWDLRASYTRISYNRSGSINADAGTVVLSPFVFPSIQVGYQHLHGSFKTTYNEWDVLVAKDFKSDCCATFTPYAGVAGLYIDQNVNTRAFDDATTDFNYARTRWSNNLWAVGLRAGSDLTVQIFDCFRFIGKGEATILTGEDDPHNHQRIVGSSTIPLTREIDLKGNENCYHIFPGYHIAAGFAYEGSTCGWDWGARIGYEFIQWWNIARAPVLDDHTSSNRNDSFGYQGLFAGIEVKF